MMDTYAYAREQFNRATFDPPTPEMQLASAEEVQREPDDQPVITLRFGLGLLALSLAMIGVHWVWAVRL